MLFEGKSIKEIGEWFQHTDSSEVRKTIQYIESDTRSGVQKLIQQWYKREENIQKQHEHWHKINQLENQLRAEGITFIAGIDEVGRGPLAGPVVAAAVILPTEFILLGLNDSKKVSSSNRDIFAEKIRNQALAFSIAYVPAEIIDEINIYQATKKAMVKAINDLHMTPEFALIDAMEIPINMPQKSLIKGDSRSASIAAASIIAKVSRDSWMKQAAQRFPQYGFERHMGYGTKEHMQAIEQHGLCTIHRQSFLSRYMS